MELKKKLQKKNKKSIIIKLEIKLWEEIIIQMKIILKFFNDTIVHQIYLRKK